MEPVTTLTPPVVALLRARHEDYTGDLGRDWWKLVRDAYEGSGGFRTAVRYAGQTWWGEGSYELGRLPVPQADLAASYLARYPRERVDQFARRVVVSTYTNFVAPVVEEYAGHFWRRQPQRETTDPEVTRFWADADGQGTGIDDWMAHGTHHAQLYGWAAALVDREAGDGVAPAGTVATYARWLEPEELADWQLAADGTFEWARLVATTEERDPFSGERTVRETYTTWTRDEFWRVDLVQQDGTWSVEQDHGRVDHSLGRVPLAVLYWRAPASAATLYGGSQVDGIASTSVELFNLRSELREWERGQNFAVFYVQSQDRDALNTIKLGVHNGIVVEPGMVPPGFAAPPAETGLHLMARIAGCVESIFDESNLERPNAVQTRQASGVARSYTFSKAGAVLQRLARHCEAFEADLLGLVALWADEDPAALRDASRIAYPESFDLDDLQTTLETQLTALANADGLTPEVLRAARLRIGRALNPQATPAEDERLGAEVERRYQAEALAFEARFPEGASAAPATPVDVAAQHAATVASLPAAAPGTPVVEAEPLPGTTPRPGMEAA